MKPTAPALSATAFDRIGCELIAEALRSAGGPVVVLVGGSSMVPAIWPGDRIEVSPAGDAPVAEGQVALFSRDGRLFAHRIVRIVGSLAGAAQFITRGDALAACDPPVPRSEVLGYVSAVVRDGRRIPMASQAPSRSARMLSFAIRNSGLVRRLTLGFRARRRRSYRMVSRCPA